ncbi:17-beta-hydroxysteroid dehydrogenase type 6 [Trichonephila clavata]|uniref:17-beta-hydroxysteroid dehydrogenase type 6 n=1 Tax=Trichonephila clavata TaxID=2740835 RepID=A0A8X6KMU5_TRICU|nr:17-beta-hydroxysteroid dehydrogenase type 6 [Trichonephila clavata]
MRILLRSTTPLGIGKKIGGCDTGFGLELVKRLSGKGFTVYACCLSLDSEGAQELAKGQFGSGEIKVLQLDVTKHDQVQATVKKVEADLGDKELWSLVNNAGWPSSLNWNGAACLSSSTCSMSMSWALSELPRLSFLF